MSSRRILVMAGGTGGHVYPALAVAECLADRGWQIDWVGTERGIEARVVPAAGFALHTLAVLGLRGKGIWTRVRGMARLLMAGFQALRLVMRLKPSVVLSMGGYAAGPGGAAAVLLRLPLVVHEQNAVAGTTNRLLAPYARKILAGLPGAFTRPHLVVGNPIRREIAATHPARPEVVSEFSDQRPLRLLVLGGSLGSAPLNQRVPAAIAHLVARTGCTAIEVRHQCGAEHTAATESVWQGVATRGVEVTPFIDDMAAAYDWADVAVCRSGALTVSELAATGTPSILVPLPHAIDDHQRHNAQVLVDAGAAEMIPQAEMTADHLADCLHVFIEQPGKLMAMATAAAQMACLCATEDVVSVLEEVSHGS